ncbi:Tc5 transposase DNA-binding domain [Popillia japonica]|uniref:Tc5 transposase DNA-binding domain n=1 Tax=Popillia japonica TaxID=7064 RepID=A0AAW1KR08_POPJA
MPRTKRKKTGIGKISPERMKEALISIKDRGLSTKAAAKRHNIPRTTLRRYKQKFENIEDITMVTTGLSSNYTINKIFSSAEEEELCNYLQICAKLHYGLSFSSAEEEELCNYLQICAKLHYGLSPKDVRRFAYSLAVANQKRIPQSWHEHKMAGKYWMTNFLKRNPLSIRKAEATSLGRTNVEPVVQKLFANLKKVFDIHEFRSDKIYNVDETALTTVQETGKVIAMKEEAPASHSNNKPKEKTTPPHQIISPDVLRPYPKGNLKNTNRQTAESRTLSYQIEEAPASHSNNKPKEKTTPPHQIISPDVLRPYPKGNLKNTNRQKRQKKTTEILTSTPVFKDIEEQELANERRTQSISKVKTSTRKKNMSFSF